MNQQTITCPSCNNQLELPATGWSGEGECPFCSCKFQLRYDPEVLLTSLNPELPRPVVKPTYAPAPVACPDCLNELEVSPQVWNGKVRCQLCACKFRLWCRPEIVELPHLAPAAPADLPMLLPPTDSPSKKPQPFAKAAPAIKLASSITAPEEAQAAEACQATETPQAPADKPMTEERPIPVRERATEELPSVKTPYQETAYTSILAIPNKPVDSLPLDLDPEKKIVEAAPIDPRLLRSKTQLNLLLNGKKLPLRYDPEDFSFPK